MTTISLSNAGLIPMEAVTTMGVSAKDGENPIGFFGTGLKYAIASLLRTSQKITIWRGLDRYDFAVIPGVVRGKDFDFIDMTGPDGAQRLGFTTHLGAHWEGWQIFRELYSNCLDEHGELSFSRVSPQEGWTTIWVTGENFANSARERDRVFLDGPPLYRGTDVDIYPSQGSGIYYRGVLVGSLGKPGAYTYNITTSAALTEDRTLKDNWYAHYYIAKSLAKCTDRPILERVLCALDRFEENLQFSEIGETFGEVALALAERKGTAAVLPNAVKAAEAWAQREARVKPIELTPRENREIEEAKRFLAALGFPVEHPIIVTETLGPGVFGMARKEKIFLSRTTLQRGGNFLIGTILEEHLHLSQGFADESRGFQDFLIDLVVKLGHEALFDRAAALRAQADGLVAKIAA